MLTAASRRLLHCSRQVTVAATTITRNKYTLPELPYKCNALEPVISGEIMELHHGKHHATYVNNLNAAEEKLKQAIEDCDIRGTLEVQQAIKFNGGGHLNHSIFWTHLSPDGGGKPAGDLAAAIDRDFGSFENFQEQMLAKTVAIQGSGWGWLGYSKTSGRLMVGTTANQDPLEATTGLIPLFGIDVWEHAYYLQYKNMRPKYVKAIWDVMNWKDVEARFMAAKSS